MDRPPYRIALRLLAIAAGQWSEIVAAYYQIDLLAIPDHKFFNLVWAWCIKNIPTDKREEWEYNMNLPLPGEKPRAIPTSTNVQADTDAFLAFAGAVGG